MSRHRAVRGMNLDDEYDDDDEYYGQSVEDNFCISPGTAAQFTFNRGQTTFATYMGGDDEVEVVESDDDTGHQGASSGQTDKKLNDVDRAKLNSCLEEVHNILGESRPDSVYKEIIIKHKFNLQASLDELLSKKEAPKPQRAPRQNRRNKSQGITSTDVPILKDPPSFFKSQNSIGSATNSISKVTVTPKKEPVRGFEPVVATSTKSDDRLAPQVATSCDNVTGGQGGAAASTSETMSVESSTSLASSSTSSLPTPKKDPAYRPPLPKSSSKSKQKINVQEEYSKRQGDLELLNLVVIGHVDAGKSTLMGHLLYQLGSVHRKVMHKYEQESKKLGKGSFAFAWVLDETEEERTRGVTMDVAQTKFQTPKKTVTLLDAPGHKDFIPNMITGAAQADVAILVINATKGEFETGFETGGQTREHALLARSLGVAQIIVAVNKMDTVDWSEERYNEVVKKIGQFLKQAGFREGDVSFVPCSGLGGENLTKTVREPKLSAWYRGPTLSEQIDKFKSLERPIDKPFRLNVGDVFKGQGTGFRISGRIGSGYTQPGDRAVVMPGNITATVRNVFIDEMPVQVAFAGDHVTILISGIDIANVNIGSVLCDPANPAKFSTRIRAKIVIFSLEVPITRGYPVVFHYQSVNEPAVIRRLVAQLNKSTGEVVKKKPRCLVKNTSAVVEIELERNICLEEYKDFKDLGRFMLRSGGATIAAGLVEEILPPKMKEDQ
ncbi:HBS1-like protein isoform X1 [Haliotis cracherodii]|uniref:HBS1-like protein isoform X1 n=1 Tax=Haliotis cracherodii TaxID=6455 RepID=UPI0039EA6E23